MTSCAVTLKPYHRFIPDRSMINKCLDCGTEHPVKFGGKVIPYRHLAVQAVLDWVYEGGYANQESAAELVDQIWI